MFETTKCLKKKEKKDKDQIIESSEVLMNGGCLRRETPACDTGLEPTLSHSARLTGSIYNEMTFFKPVIAS